MKFPVILAALATPLLIAATDATVAEGAFSFLNPTRTSSPCTRSLTTAFPRRPTRSASAAVPRSMRLSGATCPPALLARAAPMLHRSHVQRALLARPTKPLPKRGGRPEIVVLSETATD
ncbi:hypothetical protein C8R47DRAFT_802786 [Mycena vitilis]|nr:hypothetical protein C8R47DRAFT_1078186 [Mycena vitilis]KAJ6469075.1 hypothetical protein C8R47DRAFT_802786 [Mycena vitilis]